MITDDTKLEKDEILAIQNLHKGEATEYQQKLALYVIVNKLCRSHDVLYIPDSFDQTAFINGRAYPGNQILKLLNVKIGKMNDKPVENNQ